MDSNFTDADGVGGYFGERNANMTVAGTSIGSVAYTHTSGDVTLTVTEEDVARGYVTVTVDFSALSANTRFCLTTDNLDLTGQD